MNVFLDSSALAKRYVDEPGSERVHVLCRNATELAVSVLCLPEIVSALNRRKREEKISDADYARLKRWVLRDVAHLAIWNLTPSVIATSISLLESNPLRAMDALQVACAVESDADLFVSADARQNRAAQRVGLKVEVV